MNYPKLDLSDWTISDNPKHKLNNKSTLITINSYYNTIKKTLEIMPFPKPTSYTLLKKNLPLLKLHLTTDIVERRIRKNRKLRSPHVLADDINDYLFETFHTKSEHIYSNYLYVSPESNDSKIYLVFFNEMLCDKNSAIIIE